MVTGDTPLGFSSRDGGIFEKSKATVTDVTS